MASSTALKAAYLVEVEKIGDTLNKARATYLLDRWTEALDAQNSLESGSIQSYSIAGRSVTKANLKDGQAAIDQLESQLYLMIYGSESIMDLNNNSQESYPQDI